MNSNLKEEFFKIPGWLSKNEGKTLYDFAKSLESNGEIVEIGSFCGKSTCFLAQGILDSGISRKIFAIDPFLGITHEGQKKEKSTFKQFENNIKKYKFDVFVTPVRNKSWDAVKHWKNKISLLFVDGLHEFKFVKKDLSDWLKFVDDGGVVICHDAFTPEPGVFQAVDEEIFDSGKFRYVAAIDSMIVAIKGKPRTYLERINLWRSTFFLRLATRVWQNNSVDYSIRYFVVNRLLKIFFFNKYFWTIINDK